MEGPTPAAVETTTDGKRVMLTLGEDERGKIRYYPLSPSRAMRLAIALLETVEEINKDEE